MISFLSPVDPVSIGKKTEALELHCVNFPDCSLFMTEPIEAFAYFLIQSRMADFTPGDSAAIVKGLFAL